MCRSKQSCTVTFTAYVELQPSPLDAVYVTTDTPTPADTAENTLPVTPRPDHTPPAGVALNNTSVSLKHTRIGTFVAMILAPGFTVIVNVRGVPTQLTPPNTELGVTVIVAVIGNNVGLTATKLGILPIPDAPNPMLGSLLVQLNTVPTVALVNVIALVDDPTHSVWLATAFTVAVGFTVILKLVGVDVQPPLDGVTTIVPVIGDAVPLVAVKLPILPLPDDPRPIAVLVFVQLYTVPAGPPLNVTALLGVLLHSVWSPTPFTAALGLTVIVNDTGTPKHVMPALV